MASREHSLRAQLATEYRRRDTDPARIEDLRRQLAAQQAEDQLRRILGGAPPLTPDQRRRLAALVLDGPGDAAA